MTFFLSERVPRPPRDSFELYGASPSGVTSAAAVNRFICFNFLFFFPVFGEAEERLPLGKIVPGSMEAVLVGRYRGCSSFRMSALSEASSFSVPTS